MAGRQPAGRPDLRSGESVYRGTEEHRLSCGVVAAATSKTVICAAFC